MPKDTLLAIQLSEFRKAAKFDRTQFVILGVISLLSLASQPLPQGITDSVAAILLSLLAAASFWVSAKTRGHRTLGEQARRATVFVDGLGLHLSGDELRRMQRDSGLSPSDVDRELKRFIAKPYFGTTAPQGINRAASMVKESAEYSEANYRTSASWSLLLSIASFLLMLLCLLWSLLLLPPTQNSTTVRVFASAASSLVFVEMLLRFIQYRAAENQLGRLLAKLAAIPGATGVQDDFLIIFADYNFTVQGAPLFPPWVHKNNKEILNQLPRP